MEFNNLVPELSVSNFEKSLDFYTKILGFKIEYDRPEKNFAYLSFQGSQLMIDGGNIEKSAWFTGKLEYPRGRGVHFQLDIDDLKPMIVSLKKNKYPIKEKAKDYWFRKDNKMIGMRGILVMDPDGYLLMFNEALGEKEVS